MIRIKIRSNGKWTIVDKYWEHDWRDALDAYNGYPVPRMLIGPKGIIHKQYTDNGFVYNGGKNGPV